MSIKIEDQNSETKFKDQNDESKINKSYLKSIFGILRIILIVKSNIIKNFFFNKTKFYF
jgi:hypothetical protein